MVKNIAVYIFIYIFIVGCSSDYICEDCYIEITATDLIKDANGYYHMNFISDYFQTFTTLKVETGITNKYQKIGWVSNKEVLVGGYWTNTVNPASYTDMDDGTAYTVLSVWEILIGDTVKVYSGYWDDCNIHHVDSLEVIVDE